VNAAANAKQVGVNKAENTGRKAWNRMERWFSKPRGGWNLVKGLFS
jgi:hypothetical protein